MELAQFRLIDASDCNGIQFHVKQEPQNEYDNFTNEPVISVVESNSSFQGIKIELESDEEIIEIPSQTIRKEQGTDKHGNKNALRNDKMEGEKNEPVVSVVESNSSFQRIKIELENDEEIIQIPSQTIRKEQGIDKHGNKNALRNDKMEGEKNGRHELTQLPCIVNIRSSAVLRRHGERPQNGTLDTSNGIPNTSLQSSNPKRICESNGPVALNGAAEQNNSNNNCESNGPVALNEAPEQNSSNNNFTTKIYEMLVCIQSTLKDLKAEVADNSKRIDKLQKCLPQPWSFANSKNDFNFPISTEEQLLELEKQLEDNEMVTKLVVHLTSRTFSTWKEMVLRCLKYMLAGDVAVLYNLNGIKGSKKKFRDLNICNILVECVRHKFKEATPLEILKRISLSLSGAKDWQGSRHKRRKFS